MPFRNMANSSLTGVEGSVNNVIGLPVERIAETLRLNGLL